MKSFAAASFALMSAAQAHIIMNWPVPYTFTDMANKQAPLIQAEFPCKVSSYNIEQENQWGAGETKPVVLQGGATHSGGSCQFSVTTDRNPTRDSQWKVIHSVLGGCPNPFAGNADGTAEFLGNPNFDVTMPKQLPDGQYTFAWTWLNKSGNREFYMNCAPITVSGGDGDAAFLGSLPDMYVSNLALAHLPPGGSTPKPADYCQSLEGQDFIYPNPGSSVVGTGSGSATEGPGCEDMNSWGAGNGQMGSPSGGDGPAPAPETPAPETPAPAPETPAPAPAPAPVPETPAPAPAPPAGGACVEGSIVCMGSNQFGICAHGTAIPQPLAAGTTCSNGAIMRK